MTTTPTPRLSMKVRRQVWIEAEHPRDRKGRFIEKGAIVRVWGGFLGKVFNNIGNGRIEIVRETDGKHVIVHRNYLTVVSRPDGSAPTDKRDANPASLVESSASPDAEEAPTPTAAPNVDTPGQSTNLYDLLVEFGDQGKADLVREAARDYQTALNNGIPDDEADERDGLLAVLDEVEAMYGYDHDDKPRLVEALTLLRDAAEAEPPADTRPDFTPVSQRFTAGGARQVATAVDEYDGDAGVTVDGEKVTITDPDAARGFVDASLPLADALAENPALPEIMRGSFALRREALRNVAQTLDGLAGNAKRVYDGANEGGRDESAVRGDGGEALPGVPAGADGADRGPEGVLREPRGADGAAGGGDGGSPARTRPGDGDVRGEEQPVRPGPARSGSDGGPRDADPAAGADGTAGREPGGDPGRVRPAAGPVLRAEGPGDGDDRSLTPGQVVYWRNPDPDDFITTRRGRFTHYGADGTAYFDYDRPLTAVERRRGVRRAPVQRQRARVQDLAPENPDAPSAAEVEWRTRNEPGYTAPAPADPETERRRAAHRAEAEGAPAPRLPKGARVMGYSANGTGYEGTLDHYDETTGKPWIVAYLTDFGRNGRVRMFEVERVRSLDEPTPAAPEDIEDAREAARREGRDLPPSYAEQLAAADDDDHEIVNPNVPRATPAAGPPVPQAPEDIEDERERRRAAGEDLPPSYAEALAAVPEDDHETVTLDSAEVEAMLSRLNDLSDEDLEAPDAEERVTEALRPSTDSAADWDMARLAASEAAAEEPDAAEMVDNDAAAAFEERRAIEEGAAEAGITTDAFLALLDRAGEVDLSDPDAVQRLLAEERARENATRAPEEPLPTLPDRFEDLDAGTRIRVGWEDSAHDATFIRTEQSPYGTVVHYREDNGATGTFVPTRGEAPRAARPNRAVEQLQAEILGSAREDTDVTGNRILVGPAVGSWVTRVDSLRDEGHITIEGDYGIRGEMRATINGWSGSLGTPGDDNDVVVHPDPQVVLDRLYDGLNGPGAAERTRNEVAQGRPAAPEVGRTYGDLTEGARIRIVPTDIEYSYDAERGRSVYQPVVKDETPVDVEFVAYSEPSYYDYGIVHVRYPDREYDEDEYDTTYVAKGDRPVPAAPLLGAEAEVPTDTEGDDQFEPDPYAVPVLDRNSPRFAPSGIEDFAPAGQMAKADANLAALRVLKTLRTEGRAATPEEQTILARWAGWGAVPNIFDERKTEFASRREELRTLLDPTEWNRARKTTLNAHYTDPRVVEQVWAAMRALGFNGGRVLEPGSGSGTFIGYRPEGTDMVGVELDSTTAAISKYLYPDADVRSESFGETRVPNDAFDATVGNVPFGNFPVFDPIHNSDGHNIHNHFILKSLNLTRPGGIVAVMSSRYTLDSLDDKARKAMFEQADLIGAVRFPNGSHARIAGTDVIEDLLIFRKRLPGEDPQADDSWLTARKRDLNGWEVGVSDYFTKHADRVLGTLTARKGRYGGEVAVEGDVDTPDLPDVLADVVADARRQGLTMSERAEDLPTLLTAEDRGRYQGHIRREEDGTYTIATGGAVEPFEGIVKRESHEEFDALLGIRDTLMALLTAEANDDPRMDALRAELNTRYDAYVDAYGPLNRFTYTKSGSRQQPDMVRLFVNNDPKGAVVKALEAYTPPARDVPGDTGSASKASIFSERGVAPRTPRTKTDDPADALTLSMDRFGFVNLAAIADMLDTDEDDARARLGTLVFEEPPLTPDEVLAAEQAAERLREDPNAAHLGDLGIGTESLREPGTLMPAAEYLSGNVRRKLAAARAAAEQDERYRANVEALTGVIPRDLGPDEIEPTLGAAWIDAQTIEDFANYMLRVKSWDKKKVRVSHSGGSIWRIEGAGVGSKDAAKSEWGTDRKPFHQLLQSLLEQRPISVTTKGKQDLDETLAAQAKAEEIHERFKTWVWEDPERARRLTGRYNDLYNNIALRQYDGSGRTFDGMSEDWVARVQPHVKDAVERIVNEPTALLAHVVGAGKTAEMVMGTQELKRLGLARKPAIVVPNHMLEQFTREYLEIYPSARILTAGQSMTPEQRRQFVGAAATGDWDAVIMTQGAFEGIPMGRDQMEAYIARELATMRAQRDTLAAEATSKADERTIKEMEAAIARAEAKLREKVEKVKDLGVSFEQTGIDYLMVDEAHEYSNLRTLSNIRGAGTTGADRATDLHMKLEYIRANSRTGRVATFATGTPIRNTVTQAYVMVRYLRPDLLEEAGIHTFDQWAATFGQVVEGMELKPEGRGFRQTQRFASFKNVPEFLRMFHTFADVKMAEDLDLPRPNLAGGKAQIISVPPSQDLKDYITWLGDRAEAVRGGKVLPTEDNMLKISTDGRKAALSMALVTGPGGMGYDHEPGKIEAAADRIASIYGDTKDKVYSNPKTGEPEGEPGAFQVVFMDMGTPKDAKGKDDEASVDDNDADFNGYDKLKAELVARGVPEHKIRYMHEAKNDAQKAEMFAAAREGRISVLIGSSQKMGVGTNMQRRAKALHHIDAPWRPADVEQRDGRIHRQGNLHMDMGEDVEIYRYVTEGSFDAYMWQTLERKAKFINQVMRGSLDVREIEDVGDTAMSYAEVKAIATGKPDFLTLATGETLIVKLQRLQRAHQQTQTTLRTEVDRLTAQADTLEQNSVAFTRLAEQVTQPTDDDGNEVFTLSVAVGEAAGDHGTRQTAGNAVREALLDTRNSYRWGNGPEVPIGTYRGITFTAQSRQDSDGERIVTLSAEGVPYEIGRFRSHDLKPGQGIALGLVSRMDNFVNSLQKRADDAVGRAAANRAEVANMQQRIGAEFARAHLLEAWSAKVERLRAKIQRDDAREEGRDIPFDPRIDSDEFDDPITRGSAETVETPAPVAEQPARVEVLATSLLTGDHVEFVLSEVSGTTAEGRIVAKREVAGMVFLTIEYNGQEYTRAYDLNTTLAKVGSPTSPAGVKGLVFVRTLEVKDGRVVVQVKRRSVWREDLHPRDKNGRFIETFAEVRIWGGGVGRVVAMAGGGRVEVERNDGKRVVVDAGNVEVIKSPGGDAPDAPAAPSPAAGAVGTIGAPSAAGRKPGTEDLPSQAADDVSVPAPDATPDGAAAVFTAPSGARAWLDTSEGQPVGYVQTNPDDPSTTRRYNDAATWAEDVDAEGMSEDSDGGSAESQRQMAADDANAPDDDHEIVNPNVPRADTSGGPPVPRAPEDVEDARDAAAAAGRPVPPVPTGTDDDDHEIVNPNTPRADTTGGPPVPQAPEDIEDARASAGTPNPDYDPDARAGTSESFEEEEDDDLNYPRTAPRGAPESPGGDQGGSFPGEDREVTQPGTYVPPADNPSVAQVVAGHNQPGRPDGAGTIEDPIDVQGDLDRAATLLAEGKHVRLNKVEEVSIILEKLADAAKDMEAKGEKAPDIDLCLITVPSTNLFCAQSKGIPRAQMPQLSGEPMPGSVADGMERNKRGRVDVTQAFLDRLAAEGIAVEEKSVPASFLKATQSQLNGSKVGGMMKAMREGTMSDAVIFVTRDGYVVDGHHRWAAKVGVDAGDGELGGVEQPVRMIDMEIGEALDFTNAFTAEIGIKQAGFGQTAKATVRPDKAGVARLGTSVDDLVTSLSNVELNHDEIDVDALPGRMSAAAEAYDAAMAGNDPLARAKAFLALGKVLTDVNNVLDNGGTEPERREALDDLATAVAINDANVSRLFPPAGRGGTDPGLEGRVIPESVVGDFLGNAGQESLTDGGSAAAFLIKGEDGQWRLTVERQALHDAIMADTLDGVPVSDDPTYNFFGGGPASGKGGIARMYPHLEEDAAYINPDDYKFMLPEMQPRVRAGDSAASSFVHEESSYLAKIVQAEGFARKVNVTLDGTGDSSPEAVRKKLAGARKAGYKVDAYYVSVPIEVAQERAVWRAANGTGSDRGRDVPPSVIAHTHKAVSEVLPQVAEDFDSLVVFDTNVPRGTAPNLIARKDREGRLEIMMTDKWQEFLDKARYGESG